MNESRRSLAFRLNWPVVWFSLSLLFPSTAIVQKFFGISGVIAYLVAASFLLWVGYKCIFPAFISKVTDKWAVLLLLLCFLVLLVSFFVIYPIANSGVVGSGSDADEALNTATWELLRGRYPYYPTTYLGNPISPLPGSLVLAVPFVLFGNEAYQNLFWMAAFLVAAAVYLDSFRQSLLLFITAMALSPAILHRYVIGSDHLANSLFVLVFALWTITSCSQAKLAVWKKIAPAVLLGISLSSRTNFVLLLPLILAALAQRSNWKTAVGYVAVVSTSFALVTLPFYLYDPSGFSPLHTYNKLGQFDRFVPFVGIMVPLIDGVISVLLALKDNREPGLFFRNCAVVLAFPVVCAVFLSSVRSGRPDCTFASFGIFFLFFGAMAWWPQVLETSRLQYEHRAA